MGISKIIRVEMCKHAMLLRNAVMQTTRPNKNCEINGNTWLTYPMEAYKVNPDAKGKSSKHAVSALSVRK